MSKRINKLIIDRLQPVLEHNHLIPNHHFVFGHEHARIEHIHRVTKNLSQSLEDKIYCITEFLSLNHFKTNITQ